jgi:hypothetical protein
VRFRPATWADVAAICAMQRASLVETYEPFLGRAAVEDFIAGGGVEQYFEARWHHATVVTILGEIVGVAVREGTLLDLVWVNPARAVDFYERRGFSVDHTFEDAATGLEKAVMRKAL